MDYFDELSALFESEDAELFKPKPKKHVATPDDRLINSFNEIAQFVRDNGRTPSAEADDMREAVLGTQLNSIRSDKHRVEILENYDELGILDLDKAPESLDELFNKDDGLFDSDIFDIAKLPRQAIVEKNTGETAIRQTVDNFGPFKYLFDAINAELSNGTKKLKKFYNVKEIKPRRFFVTDGMLCYVESVGEAKEASRRPRSPA